MTFSPTLSPLAEESNVLSMVDRQPTENARSRCSKFIFHCHELLTNQMVISH